MERDVVSCGLRYDGQQIASGLSQKSLADRFGLKKLQIQRYEES